ncbi:MAG TPA: TusE/DsrC/DsvC family sulfur relay protein [Gallionella sp.]|nr:TusE/DsrC/DsvC family sulfur relay protein [Gallionella sp.]
MAITTKDGTPAKFDEDGFLVDPAQWDQELAQQIASQDGVGKLSEAHWAIIRQLREHYLKSGALVPASHACHMNHQNLDCVDGLFHNQREAWRIAGLPNPGEEAKSYM